MADRRLPQSPALARPEVHALHVVARGVACERGAVLGHVGVVPANGQPVRGSVGGEPDEWSPGTCACCASLPVAAGEPESDNQTAGSKALSSSGGRRRPRSSRPLSVTNSRFPHQARPYGFRRPRASSRFRPVRGWKERTRPERPRLSCTLPTPTNRRPVSLATSESAICRPTFSRSNTTRRLRNRRPVKADRAVTRPLEGDVMWPTYQTPPDQSSPSAVVRFEATRRGLPRRGTSHTRRCPVRRPPRSPTCVPAGRR